MISIQKKKLNINFIPVLVIVLSATLFSCKTRRNLIIENNDYLLRGKVDTFYVNAPGLVVKRTDILPFLDTLILKTKSLPGFDNRLKPLYIVSINPLVKNEDTILKIYSTNYFGILDFKESVKDLGLGEDAFIHIYGILNYKGCQFIVNSGFSDKIDKTILDYYDSFFSVNGEIDSVRSFAFYSKSGRYRREEDPWDYNLLLKIKDNKFELESEKYWKPVYMIPK